MKHPVVLLVLIIAGWLIFPGCGNKKESPAQPGKVAATEELHFESKPYNVLLITLDTFRVDRMGVYSQEHVKTPNLDELASKSYVFRHAFAHNPVTLPSHVNILTGTTALYHGISDNTGFRLDDRFLTIPRYLKKQGYTTGAFIGAFPLDSRFGLNQGFDIYDDNYGTHNAMELFFVERPAEKVIAPALQWLETQNKQDNAANSKGDQEKWFAWIHLFDPHQAYLPPSPYKEQYRHDPYSGEVAYLDHCLGKLFQYLNDSGMMASTVIIVTGDHGEALGEKGEDTHAYFAYNNTIHIPLLLYIPDGGHKFIEENVCHTDIFPTICQIIGVDTPRHLQGESMLPIISGHPRKRPEIYFESLTPYLNRGWAPLRGFIRHNMKFIDLPIPEVYDMDADPNETRNLAASSDTGSVNVTQFKRDLGRLKVLLKNKDRMQRSQKLDSEVSRRLKSLGYVSSNSSEAPKEFTEAHDLKTLLPLQNSMLAALGKYQNGNPEAALVQLQQVVDQSPTFVLVYRHMATILNETGQIGKAIQVLKDGLEKNPGSVNLMSKLGIMLAEANRPDEAIDLLKLCIQKESFNPENFNFLGVAYYKKGNFAAAMENYKKALALDTNYASVYNNIGSLYLVVYLQKKDQNAFQAAVHHFDKALEIDPRLFAAYNGRGAAYKFNKQPLKAISDWKETIRINPQFIDAYFNLGITFLQLKDPTSALKYLNQCKEMFYNRLPQPEQQRLVRLIREASK